MEKQKNQTGSKRVETNLGANPVPNSLVRPTPSQGLDVVVNVKDFPRALATDPGEQMAYGGWAMNHTPVPGAFGYDLCSIAFLGFRRVYRAWNLGHAVIVASRSGETLNDSHR